MSDVHVSFAPTAAGGKKVDSGGGTGGSTRGGGKNTSSGDTTDTTSGTGGTGTPTVTTAVVKTVWQTLDPASADTLLPTDTNFGSQWGLTHAVGGINVVKAWTNYTGQGVKVGVIDDGIDYTHSDLSTNYLKSLDYDAVTSGADAFGALTDRHGTSVAGVIGAERDGTGIVGVAYNAGIAGFRISYSTSGPSQLADAIQHLVTNGMDVGNASWGYTTAFQDNFDTTFAAAGAAIRDAVDHGRGGLGTNIVFSAGNSRSSGDNVNYHNFQNSPYVITVAATDDIGFVQPFSTPGAAVLVSAPGGAILTDDRVGSAGWSTNDYAYVSGTSYAAPAVSGVIALMLQANPDLGYRDVQEILAYSAEQTDRTNASWQINDAKDWNGGGVHFSADYGFGLVDAWRAVRLAESWQYQSTYDNTSTVSVTHVDNAKIPDGIGSLTSQITVATSLELDKVVVDLNISHANVSNLIVTLTSPTGTMATLVSRPANGTGSGLVFETSANSFWGEDSAGTWTLTVTDATAGSVGTLNGWSFKGIGDVASTSEVYIYTDEFATFYSTERSVLHDTSGSASINTAAVSSGSYLDLNSGAFSTIAGKTLQLSEATVIKNVWAGDGNDTIVGNGAGNNIQGGRGNDTLIAGSGIDQLYGGPGTDTFVMGSLQQFPDTIWDFASGDTIDFRSLFTQLGYAEINPVDDGWMTIQQTDNGGTEFLANNGAGFVAIVDVAGVLPAMFQAGADHFTYYMV